MSRKKTEQSFYFDKKPRVTLHTDSISPGPGAYKFFSEFNRWEDISIYSTTYLNY